MRSQWGISRQIHQNALGPQCFACYAFYMREITRDVREVFLFLFWRLFIAPRIAHSVSISSNFEIQSDLACKAATYCSRLDGMPRVRLEHERIVRYGENASGHNIRTHDWTPPASLKDPE